MSPRIDSGSGNGSTTTPLCDWTMFFGIPPTCTVIGFVRIELWQAISVHHWSFWGIEIGHNYDLVSKDGQTIVVAGQHLQLAWTVALSLVGVVLFGTLVGSMLPFLFRRLGFDPASASAPFIATFVDVTGLIIYFNVALHVLLR